MQELKRIVKQANQNVCQSSNQIQEFYPSLQYELELLQQRNCRLVQMIRKTGTKQKELEIKYLHVLEKLQQSFDHSSIQKELYVLNDR